MIYWWNNENQDFCSITNNKLNISKTFRFCYDNNYNHMTKKNRIINVLKQFSALSQPSDAEC